MAEKIFLGWHRPVLPAAVEWLREQLAPAGRWLPDAVTVVVPTSEARWRLLELLVDAAGPSGLTPPRIETPGALPELLYQPEAPLAGPLPSLLTRVHTLKHAERGLVQQVITQLPDPDDWESWWSLGRQLSELSEDLAAAGLTLAEVPRRCAERGLAGSKDRDDRWQALATLEQAYRCALEANLGLVDIHAARLAALAAGRCQLDTPLVLLGTVELGAALTAMIEQVAGPVVALVHAPPEHADGFDAIGGLRPEYWRARRVTLHDSMLRVCDRPADQATEVVRVLAERAAGRYAADQVTIGLGDKSQAGAVKRALILAELPARHAAGTPLADSPPALLLAALGRFVGQYRFDSLAELVRHPDIASYLDTSGMHRGTSWLTLLDDYAAKHLHQRLDGQWLDESSDRQKHLQALWRAVLRILDVDPKERRALPRWSPVVAAALQKVYGNRSLIRHSAEHEPLIGALEGIATVLREQAMLPADAPGTPQVTAAQAINFVLARLRDQALAEPGGSLAIELTGYLDLPLDDAPLLLITSMNEGAVPVAPAVDPFLPDRVRGALGLSDDTRRYARDLFFLQSIVHSRAEVVLLACRRDAEGQPLAPSRLLLACDDATLVRRIHAFYDDAPGRRVAPLLLIPGPRSEFLIPFPTPDDPRLDELSVSGFSAYLACPYRFYLRYVRKLKAIDDGAVELDGPGFGKLAHRILEEFGRSPLSDCPDKNEITAFLSRTLDQQAAGQFGRSPRPALRVQMEQLRARLEAFACEQATMIQEGWRIVGDAVEAERRVSVMVDGEAFTIKGRIDRIDHHPVHGWRILDYKTGDTGKNPEKTHRQGPRDDKSWVDLQLPLYRDLYARDVGTQPVELGYLNLSKNLGGRMLECTEWGNADLDSARDQRDQVIRSVRRQEFWPPRPSSWPDELAGLCADQAPNREEIIRASTRSRS